MSSIPAGHCRLKATEPIDSPEPWTGLSDTDISLPYSVNDDGFDLVGKVGEDLTNPSTQPTSSLNYTESSSYVSDDDLGLTNGPVSSNNMPGSDLQVTDEISERLTKSLDLGHGSFGYSGNESDFAFLDEDQWSTYTDSARHAQSLPRGSSGVFSKYKAEAAISANKPDTDQTDKIKTKFMSAWNNMRHGWMVKMKTSFKYDSPIWLMGRCYHISSQEKEDKKNLMLAHGTNIQVMTGMDRFKHDFTSRLWFTYRRDFPPLEGTQITTDVGWGCMLRTGQMMIAHALLLHFLSRDWRWHRHQKKHEVIYHHQILRFFGDQESKDSPFSIHKLTKIGSDMDKKPGDWYGPASVAYVLRDAMEQAPHHNPVLGQLSLYVAQDCTVYKQDVIDQVTRTWPKSRQNSTHSSTCSMSSVEAQNVETPEDPWRPVIILIPVRLGGESFNPVYIPCLQAILAHDMCLGIIGGKPKHSVYFVGWQEDKLVYLDPHFCQDNVNFKQRDFPVHSYHCMFPRKMSFTKMDPSCTIGFFCKTRLDFENFVHEASKMASPPKEQGQYPMFVFSEGRSCDVYYTPTKPSNQHPVKRVNEQGLFKQQSKESDDYVFL